MAQIKGNLLLARLKFLHEKAAPDQVQSVLNQLTPECRRAVTGSILAVAWYPIEYVFELMAAMEQGMGQGSPRFVEELGRFSAQQAYRGLYKLFFKFGSPEFILKRCPMFWGQLMDSGKLDVTMSGPRQANLGLTGFDQQLPKVFMRSLAGWSQGLMEVSGAKNVRVEILQWPSPSNFNTVFSLHWD